MKTFLAITITLLLALAITAPTLAQCPGGICSPEQCINGVCPTNCPDGICSQRQTREGRWSESWTPVTTLLEPLGVRTFHVSYRWTRTSNTQAMKRETTQPPKRQTVRYIIR